MTDSSWDKMVEPLVRRVHEAALAQRSTVACAESLTAGLLTSALASVGGASDVLAGGVVAYTTTIKQGVLGVDRELLRSYGQVHGGVAEAMASSVLSLCGATVGVATTGVAGPGPYQGHPAGTVYLGWATREAVGHELVTLTGARGEVRRAATQEALRMLGDVLEGRR